MLIHHFLERAAERQPEKNAVWYKNEWTAFGRLELLAKRLANSLREAGVKRGDRVAQLYENSCDYIVAYYAILKIGAVAVPLSTEVTARSLLFPLIDSGARALITNRRFARHLPPVLPQTPELKLLVVDQTDVSAYEKMGLQALRLQDCYEQGSDNSPDVRVVDRDLASIVYTSGSTGQPKGVMHTHLNMVSNTHSIVEYLALTAEDRMMVVLPFYYIYGKSLLNTHFCVGGQLVLDNRFAYPNTVLDTMEQTAPTGFAGVPSTFIILLHKSNLAKRQLPALRYVTQAGGAMAPAVQKEAVEVFAPAKVFIMYGATEAAPRLSYLEPDMLPQKWGSIGKAIPNVELFPADQEGNPLPPGEVGELAARGSNIMPGYWNDPEGSAQVLRHGLYFTGDLGRMDEDGYLYVVGRDKDMIKAGGFRVSAKEVEEALLEMGEIREAAVIGVEDDTLSEAIKAFIVTADGAELDDEAVRRHLHDRLPPSRFPKYFDYRSSLPKNEFGKVMKEQLREEEEKRL